MIFFFGRGVLGLILFIPMLFSQLICTEVVAEECGRGTACWLLAPYVVSISSVVKFSRPVIRSRRWSPALPVLFSIFECNNAAILPTPHIAVLIRPRAS
jgi:hypothetical protein